MASIPRCKSSPHLQKLDEVTYLVVGTDTLSWGGECTEEDGEMSEMDDAKSTDTENISVSGESVNNTLLSPDIHAYMSENDASPILQRKKRRAPLPPDMSPTMAERHSYAFDLNALRLRTSTDTESTTSESRLFYQTSTDSESTALPESARGSNFPGELAGVENLYTDSPRRPHIKDTLPSQSPRAFSKFNRIREVFRSPQIGRRNTRRVKTFLEKTPRLRKIKAEDGDLSANRRSTVEDGSKSPKSRNIRSFDPIPEMSDCVLVGSYDVLDAEQEFAVKRIPDYEKFLSGLLEVTDSSHVDYVDISKNLNKVRSMMKEREDELRKEDNSDIEGAELRSSLDNLNQESTHAIRNSTDNSSMTEQSNSVTDQSGSNNNNNNNNDSENKSRGQSRRRKSAPSAVLFKSLSSPKSKSPTSIWYNAGLSKKDNDVMSQFNLADGDSNRRLIMEGSVQFVTGMHKQELYLFLLCDLLLVTKQKSNTTFKLKHKVQLSGMWIDSCIDDVSETTRPADRSFVLGWPTTNVVATFPTVDLKADWLTKLSENITKEKLKDEDRSLQMKVALRDITSTTCQTCQITINIFTQAREVVLDCLKQINIPENDVKDYQLWVVSGKDASPYPLIGHETPFSIKLSQVRHLPRSRSGNELDNMTATNLETVVENSTSSEQKCEFYLKQKKTTRKNRLEHSPLPKQMKKNKKSPNIFTIFRKKRAVQHLVFGHPIPEICNENYDPPEAIIKLMVLVYQQGPHTPGILRKGNNAALSKEIREKIDSGDKYSLEDHMAPTAASVFKEFLRCLPGGLLMSSLHEQWLTVKKDDPYEDKINKIKTILGQLPPQNYHMIKLTICLLQHLAKHSSENHMGPSNLATCIAPSFYAHEASGSHEKLKEDVQKQMQNSVNEIQNIIVPLISFLIKNHVELFGEDILNMFVKYGCEASPMLNIDEERYDSQIQPSAEEDEEEDMVGEEEDDEHFNGQCLQKQHRLQLQQRKQHMLRDSNSGTDSDSMHSVLSMQDAGVGLQRDDSSIDSLGERDYYAHESPKTVKSHLSPSNLSRDSGLTLSDNQLYDEESYQIDIAAVSAKMFPPQRTLHFTDQHDMDLYDRSRINQGVDVPFDRCVNPVPPPRKRSIRRKVDNDGRRYGSREDSHRVPLTHSASTTHLADSQNIIRQMEHRSMLTHSSLDKRVSSESIGEEEESADNKLEPVDFQRMRERTDIGTLIKSESGAKLFLTEHTKPTNLSLGTSEMKSEQHFIRQSSGTSSIVPVSPESRHSQSSCDSVISDSTCSISRDGSINSAPQTPDEPQEKSLNWVPDINLPGKPWQGMFTHVDTQQPNADSKSTADLLSRKKESIDDNLISNNSPKMWSGKSHEAEEVQMSGKPHFSLMNWFNEYPTIPSSQTSATNKIPFGKQRFSAHFDVGSPPPNVLLKNLQSPAKGKFGYDSATVAHIRHSNVDSLEPRHLDISKDKQAIRPEEYNTASSKPVIISPEGASSGLVSSNSSRAKRSKYIGPRLDLPMSFKDRDFVHLQAKKCPVRPLTYNQAMQENFTMKYNLPDDVTEAQRQISARAKEIYEKSLQLYNEQNQTNDSDTLQLSDAKLNSELVISSNPVHHQESQSDSIIDDTMTSNLTTNNYLDTGHSSYASEDSFQPSVISDNSDDSGASGFLDMGSISSSLQEDLVSRRNKYAERSVGSVSRDISGGSLTALSRNDSKLSDTCSSSDGSSVTISTLSKHSDSFGRRSDLSNTSSATVSSVTSSDSNSDLNPAASRHGSLTRYDEHSNLVQPRSRRCTETEAEVIENSDEPDNDYVPMSKKAEKLYSQSIKMYEQNSESRSSTLPRNKPSLMKSPFLNYQPQDASTAPKMSPFQAAVPSFTKQTNAATERSKKSTVSLEVPTSNLHRSRSDSADRAHKLGAYSFRSTKTEHEDSENGKDIKQLRSKAYTEHSKEKNIKSLPRDIKSEHHQNFMRAKYCFHQQEVPKSSASYHSAQSAHRSPISQARRSGKLPESSLSSTVAADVVTESALTPELKPQVPCNNPPNSTSREHKKEFHWSVKDLKSIYDKDKSKDTGDSNNSSSSTESTSQISQPHSPPPFIHHPDSPRHSTSSSDQVPNIKSSKKTFSSHRQGPQSYAHEICNSYSSSEDSYSSSPERRQTWLSSSSLDNEELEDYANAIYI